MRGFFVVEYILTIINEGHIRIIPAKFVKIQLEVYEEISFEAIVDDGHPAIMIAHIEPLAQVRFNMKIQRKKKHNQ